MKQLTIEERIKEYISNDIVQSFRKADIRRPLMEYLSSTGDAELVLATVGSLEACISYDPPTIDPSLSGFKSLKLVGSINFSSKDLILHLDLEDEILNNVVRKICDILSEVFSNECVFEPYFNRLTEGNTRYIYACK